MPGTTLHALTTAVSSFHPARHQRDAGCALDRAADRHGLPLPPGLSLEWLGTAGFALGYQGETLLIDPYVSRASARDVILGRRVLVADPQRIDRHLPQASAVLVGHTHFDHALDLPELARRRGCRVYGSRSLSHLMALHGLGDRAVQVEPGRPFELGPFRVTFVESLHARLLFGRAVPNGGEITCEHAGALHAGDFKCGQVFGIRIEVAGTSFYHLGSAELIESQVPRGEVDHLLLGIAGRSFSHRFVERALATLKPRHVIPHHYDDFFRPVDAELRFSFNVNFASFLDEVAAVTHEVEVRTLQPLLPIVGQRIARAVQAAS